jgi:hypothetical protein
VSKRFIRERGSTRRLRLSLVAIAGVLLIPIIALKHTDAIAQSSGTAITANRVHAAFTAKQIKARDDYWISKLGIGQGVPTGALNNAIEQTNEEESSGTLRKLTSTDLATTFSWQFLGPDPINLLTYYAPGDVFGSPHTGAGALTALAVDSSGDIFAGSADGGVYLSTDGGSNFSQVFNGEPTEAIGAIAIDTTKTPNWVYVGTGNPNGSIDAYYGAGVFRSTDLGSTWTQIMPASFADGEVSVSKIALDPANNSIFVGAAWAASSNRAGASDIEETDITQAGLWVSTDGGNTFTQYAPSALGNCYIGNTSLAAPCPVDDVEIDPETNSSGSHNVYVSVDAEEGVATNSGGIFRSTNEGGTFALIPGLSSLDRSSIAIGSKLSGQPASQAYFMLGDSAGVAYLGFYYTNDGGASAPTKFNPPSFTAGGITFDGSNGNTNQSNSFYDQALVVYPPPPANTTAVFFGGVGIYKTGNNGSSFQSLVNQSAGGAAANQHAMAYDPSTDQMLVADDGGLYSFNPALTPTSSAPITFTSLNATIDTTLVQTVGPHPTNNSLVWAGFQGAGTEQYNGSVNNPNGNWYFPTSEAGDGGFVEYDPANNGYVYHTYSNPNVTGTDTPDDVSFAFSANGGQSWSSDGPSQSLSEALASDTDAGAAYYPPIAVDPTAPERVFFGAHGVYVSNDGGQNWVPQASQDLTAPNCPDGTCAIEDIEPINHSNAWALTMSDPVLAYGFELWNTTQLNEDTSNSTNGGTWIQAMSGLAGAGVNSFSTQATGIAIDHADTTGGTAYLSLSGFYASTGVGHIYKTADFGNTWVEADGGTAQSSPPTTALPDVPVLRVLVDTGDNTGNTVYAATDIGVFKSSDGGNTWGSFNLGTLQAVPVFDIEENQNNTIYIGTHGKGVFQLIEQAPSPTPTPTPSATPSSGPTPSPTATPTPPPPTPTPTPAPTPVPGALAISPASITFPTEAFGQAGATSPPKTITVTNTKKKNEPSITVESVTPNSDGKGTYTLVTNSCTGVLAPGQKCTFTVTYTPLIVGKSSSTVVVNNNSSTKPTLSVKVAGTGSAPVITAKPTTLNFGKVNIHTTTPALTATLTNKNAVPVTLTGVATSGKDPGDYAVDYTAGTCGTPPSTLAANSTCTVAATFTPAANGSRAATLVISGSIKSPVTIKLSGTGE